MSTQKKKAELLTFGYVKRSYDFNVPISLISVIRLFFDSYYYWYFNSINLQKFLTAKNGDIFYSQSFKIKGIEFQCLMAPNGPKMDDIGLVFIALSIKRLPKEIEYVEIYYQFKCENVDCLEKRLTKYNIEKQFVGGPLCKLSELKDVNGVHFNYLIDIRSIKYKKQYKKKNYIAPINKMKKMSHFTWNIDGLLMEKCKEMIFKQRLRSDNFENNNWYLLLAPNGGIDEGQTEIYLNCLSIPFNIKSINIKYTFLVNEDIKMEGTDSICNEIEGGVTRTSLGESIGITFSHFIEQQSMSIDITLEIVNVYDENDKMIDQNEWHKYGIIINDQDTN